MKPNRILSSIAYLLLYLSIGLPISAKDSFTPDTISVKVFFVQGSSKLNPNYHNNKTALDLVDSIYSRVVNDPNIFLTDIVVIPSSSASPEGNSVLNQNLCMNRARNTARYLSSRLNVFVDARSGNYEIDWKLLEETLDTTDVYYRDKALDIIRNTPLWVIKKGRVTDSRKRQLMNLYGGKAWDDMLSNVFYDMRYATVRITFLHRHSQPDPQGISGDTAQVHFHALPDSIVLSTPACYTLSQPRVAVRNNMLLDAVAVPNIGLEVAMSKHLSLGADWMYAWWNPNATIYWRVYGGDAWLRYYPWASRRNRPLTGQHLGVYGGIVTYDFEIGERGYLGERWSWFTGLEYGWSVPVTKRLNIDFGIGVGFMGGEYKAYDYEEGYYVWKYTARRNWIGPTKADVSLVWMLGGKKKYKPVYLDCIR